MAGKFFNASKKFLLFVMIITVALVITVFAVAHRLRVVMSYYAAQYFYIGLLKFFYGAVRGRRAGLAVFYHENSFIYIASPKQSVADWQYGRTVH